MRPEKRHSAGWCSVKCGGCEKEYIGETARTLGVRFKEHTDGKHPNSAVTAHTSTTGHKYSLADVKVLVREDSDLKRKVKEAIAIHKKKNSPELRQRPQNPPFPPPTCVM